VELIFPSDAVIVVAGVPGAGKTTLLRRAVDRATARVVDTDDRPRRGPLLYPGHYARIAAAIAGGRPAVIHSRGTHALARRTIALLARLRGRPAHLILLNADRATAEAGQRARGRTVASEEMDRQVARWHELLAAPGEGWASTTVLDRAAAADVSALRFVTAPALTPVPA
jgi:deoxyadenosine/deoxycytidine kinase